MTRPFGKVIPLRAGVKTDLIRPDQDFLLAIEPRNGTEDIVLWVERNLPLIQESLLKHGGILFRGFQASASGFREIADRISPEDMPYLNGVTPREKYSEGLYLASSFPRELTLAQHHEMSYMRDWPMKVFFYCDVAPRVGGETPLCSTRAFMKGLSRRIVDRFAAKGIRYLRNYRKEYTSEWHKAFLTEDRSVVEDLCRGSGLKFEWRPNNGLRTLGNAQGLARHPMTGEMLWHNHAMNLATRSATEGALTPLLKMIAPAYPPETIQQLLSVPHMELPTNAYYGDGSFIELSVLEEIAELLEREKVAFQWQKGDFVILDNMLAFHGRNPFDGDRRILTVLKEPASQVVGAPIAQAA